MTKAETVGAVHTHTHTHTRSFIEIKEGGNTFICDKEKDRLDLYKSKS